MMTDCLRTEECVRMSNFINNKLKVACLPYHGKQSARERSAAHNKFISGEVRVIAATLAFGMGIDKPDIRCIVHWGMPKSVEGYYQQTGRGGRDGKPSQCTYVCRVGVAGVHPWHRRGTVL